MSETDTHAALDEAPVNTATTSDQSDNSAASEHNQAGVPEDTQGEAEHRESSTESGSTEATTSSDSDGFLGGKYKTKEDFESAYKELKNKHDSSVHERAELMKVLNEALVPSDTTVAVADQDDDYSGNETTATRSTDDEQRDARFAAMEFMMSHEVSSDERNAMAEILKSDPVAKQIPNSSARLEYAYLKSQQINGQKTLEVTRKQAQAAAEAKVAEKEMARVESGRKAEPVDEGAELLSKAANGSPEESAAARMALIRKHLVRI